MAEPLKNHFGPEVPRTIAAMIAAVWPEFPARRFLADVLAGYGPLALMDRGRRIADALHRYLPDGYPEAIAILIASVERGNVRHEAAPGMASFLYLPHVLFVARHGLDHFEASMRAQYLLTQKFTAEFSIRPFLERYPEKTLVRLRRWARDPRPAVRRLVSEGTRPRLPWAARLPAFQRDPRPVLELLELLKDDPALYVRRSVANNLNDIGKDHPDLLAATARRWLEGAGPERSWIVRHALRSAVKRGEPGALAALGFGATADVAIENVRITPQAPIIGGRVEIAFEVVNQRPKAQRVLVDLRVHFVKASGRTAAKVFKLKTLALPPRASARLRKGLVLVDLTTRKHYPGRHRVEAVLNGRPLALGSFAIGRGRARRVRNGRAS